MSRILIVYSSIDGHTRAICERLRSILESSGHRVMLQSITQGRVDLNECDTVIIGASVRYGSHGKPIEAFVTQNKTALDARPNTFFSVNLVARKAEKRNPTTNPYLQRFLERVPWRPQMLAVFAGKLDYPRYGFLDRLMIRLIMKMTGGPTDPSTVVDYTDWARVEQFGRELCEREMQLASARTTVLRPNV